MKTVYKSLGLSGGIFGAVPCAVDVKDGKIIRIRPLHYDSKYDPKGFNAWEITKDGKSLKPMMKALPSPFSLAYKKRTYSPNRVRYPLKRVDWDPNGERNTQNRGRSKFVRISWDEATDLIAAEIRRIHKEYGPLAILVQGDGHGECMFVHATHGCSTLLLDKMGGFTQQVRNPDSWEGWYWGAKHVWGPGLIGMMTPSDNIVKDISEHSEMVVVWGGDLEATPWGFRGQFASNVLFFWSEIGIKQIYICPGPQLRRGRPRRQVDSRPPQYRCGPPAGDHLYLDQGRHLRQGVRGDPHGRLRQGEGLRHGRGRRRAQDAGMGLGEVRRPRMDHQGPRAVLGQEDRLHRPLFRRRHDPRPLLPRAGPLRGHPPRACRGWASRGSTRRRSPTRGCRRTS